MADRESKLEAKMDKAIRARGGLTLKLTSRPGVPDRLVLLPGGRFWLVELKTSRGRLSLVQKVMHQALREIDAPVVTLSGWTEIDGWLRSLN